MTASVAILSACSGRKSTTPVVDCTDIDTTPRAELVDAHPNASHSARALYTGDEHRHVTAAVDHLEAVADVEWRIVSAGFGIVTPETVLPSYECTFRDRESIERRIARRGYDPETLTRREQIRTLATELGIPRDISELLDESIDLAFVVLGADYLLATGDSLESLPNSCTAYAFASEGSRDDIGACEWVPSTEEERATLQTTWTRLKGIQLRNLAQSLDDADDLRALDDAAAVHDRSLAGRR